MNIAFISAVLPVLVLLFFIYKKDKYQPEPIGKLIWVFVVGCFSVVPAALMEAVTMPFAPDAETMPVLNGLFNGYLVAGFSEELCKLLLLLWVIWRSPHFDEYFDGIVYAAYLSLGFACIENIGYVFQGSDQMVTALMRGVLAVPAHFLFAVTMGYYVSLAKFDPSHRRSHLWKAFLYPMLLHGTYDALLMVSGTLGEAYGEESVVGDDHLRRTLYRLHYLRHQDVAMGAQAHQTPAGTLEGAGFRPHAPLRRVHLELLNNNYCSLAFSARTLSAEACMRSALTVPSATSRLMICTALGTISLS